MSGHDHRTCDTKAKQPSACIRLLGHIERTILQAHVAIGAKTS